MVDCFENEPRQFVLRCGALVCWDQVAQQAVEQGITDLLDDLGLHILQKGEGALDPKADQADVLRVLQN